MKAQAATLIPRIRELMRQQTRASIADGFASMLDSLLELAKQSQTTEDHQLILQALDHVDRNKRVLVDEFERHVVQLYDEKIGWLNAGARDGGAVRAFGEFDLLDEHIYAQQIALKKLVQKTLEEIDRGQLLGVEVRLRDLFESSVDGARNPVGPGTVIKAAQRACATGLEDDAVQATLINTLQPYLGAGLNQLYRALNDTLIAAGVCPDYRPSIERDTSNRYATRHTESGMTVSQVMSLRDLLPDRTSTPLDLKEILAALLAGSAANRQYGARLLADQDGSLYADALDTPVSGDLLRSLTDMQGAATQSTAANGAHDLHAVVEHMASAGEHPLDRLTGELVSVVFDFLLGDRSLPEAAKGEIARLQIVALKAALLDRSFFARREHPLRILLDEIVRLAGDPTLDSHGTDRFVAGLRGIIDEIVANFETDLALFETAAERLRAIAVEATEDDEQALAEMTAALMAEEHFAHAQSLAAEAVARRMRPETPPFLRDFLERHWIKALADARVNHSADETVWEERLRVMDALMASMMPKLRSELPPFVATLPKLVRDVQAGIVTTGMAPEAARAFMDELMAVHTAVLQMRREPLAPVAVPVASPATRTDASANLAFEPRQQPATLLQRGDVVELSDREPPVCMKLLWVSPARSRYLFSIGGGQSKAMSATEVSDALARGTLRLTERDDLLNRALAAVVGADQS